MIANLRMDLRFKLYCLLILSILLYTIIYVVSGRENLLCTAYCSWLAGLVDSWGVAGGIYTDIISSEKWEQKTRFHTRTRAIVRRDAALTQREKGVIPSVLGYGHYIETRSSTFEFWWRQNWKAFTQLCLTLHSCALYRVIVLLKLFMQITSVLITSAIITLDMVIT